MLFWFIYRYWQTHKGVFGDKFPGEFVKQQASNTLKRHWDSTLPKHEDAPEQTYFRSGVSWDGYKVKVQYVYASTITRSTIGFRSIDNHQGNVRSGKLHLSGVKGWVITALLTLKTFIAEPSFASYIVPYILAALAITLGAMNLILHAFCN